MTSPHSPGTYMFWNVFKMSLSWGNTTEHQSCCAVVRSRVESLLGQHKKWLLHLMHGRLLPKHLPLAHPLRNPIHYINIAKRKTVDCSDVMNGSTENEWMQMPAKKESSWFNCTSLTEGFIMTETDLGLCFDVKPAAHFQRHFKIRFLLPTQAVIANDETVNKASCF